MKEEWIMDKKTTSLNTQKEGLVESVLTQEEQPV